MKNIFQQGDAVNTGNGESGEGHNQVPVYFSFKYSQRTFCSGFYLRPGQVIKTSSFSVLG